MKYTNQNENTTHLLYLQNSECVASKYWLKYTTVLTLHLPCPYSTILYVLKTAFLQILWTEGTCYNQVLFSMYLLLVFVCLILSSVFSFFLSFISSFWSLFLCSFHFLFLTFFSHPSVLPLFLSPFFKTRSIIVLWIFKFMKIMKI